MDKQDALRALEYVQRYFDKQAIDYMDEQLEIIRAHLTDPGYVRVPDGYAGVTVWIGEKQVTRIIDRVVFDTSRADELLRVFESARLTLARAKETRHD